ncbi:MAG: hypothetical protein HZA47_09240 [Planctomycetes bacterium]|uniref:hypothetical protein n=1 Tax=Candidatus Wunengus sp. YC65 TaxID=3367701 RepID=UPI001DE188A5|nr:hypothetical protein [Planctomycetota bacterium]
MTMFTLLIYALFKDYKRNSRDAMAKATHTDYQKLQYFLSDAKWDIQALKHKRLEIIQKQRTTASTKDGLRPSMTPDALTLCKKDRGGKKAILRPSQTRRSL